jgi:hypothetical protein
MTTAPNTTGHKPTRDLGKPSITPGMSRTCHIFHSYLQVEAPYWLPRAHFATLFDTKSATVCCTKFSLRQLPRVLLTSRRAYLRGAGLRIDERPFAR